MTYINSNHLMKLKEDGYIILKNFYDINTINKMRQIILYNMKVKKNIMPLGNGSGSKPDFLNDINYQNLIPLLNLNEMHNVMKEIFNAPFHLCFHNDIGLNRIVDWHKDTLNNEYKIFQQHNPWSIVDGEGHEIYKFLIYLQDHSKNSDGLYIIERSHLIPNIFIDNTNKKYINCSLGDVIIFDQRITHRGQSRHTNNMDRILISIGFGKNNIFTTEFEEGTRRRQNDQNRKIIKL